MIDDSDRQAALIMHMLSPELDVIFFLKCLKYLIVGRTCEGLKFIVLENFLVAIDPGLVILASIPVISGSHNG